jgi:hypothetical protein
VPIRIPITTLIAMMTGVKREEFFVLMSIPFFKSSSYYLFGAVSSSSV